MKYLHVGTKSDLEKTLLEPAVEEIDCIVEVESSIDANAIVHRLVWASSFLRFYMSPLSTLSCALC